MEYLPTTFNDHLRKDKKDAVKLANQTLKTIDFLKRKKIIHFDMHFYNILTDGVRPYITDFGLGLDLSFDLSKDEKRFFTRHINYDYGEFIGSMGFQLIADYDAFSKTKKNKISKLIDIKEGDCNIVKQEKIINALSLLKNDGAFGLTTPYINFLKKHKNTILLTTKFFVEARDSDDRNTLFSSPKLKRALLETDVIRSLS